MKNDSIELVVVFKKGIEVQAAQVILDKMGIQYRKGMDSSKGKIYFYNTGSKFIITFGTQLQKEKWITDYQNLPDVYETYTPDWTKRKD
jgi:hypothetical protein